MNLTRACVSVNSMFDRILNALNPTRLEILTAALLAIASLLAALSGYEASRWSTNVTLSNTKSSAARLRAIRFYNAAEQDQQADIMTTMGWLNATFSDNPKLADFYRARHRAEFKPVFEQWLSTDPLNNPNAPSSPFALAEYKPGRQLQAQAEDENANALVEQSNQAVAHINDFVRLALFFATALFSAAISKTLDLKNLRVLILLLSAVLVVFGVIQLLLSPIL